MLVSQLPEAAWSACFSYGSVSDYDLHVPNTFLQTDVEDSCVFHCLDIISVLYMWVVLMGFPQCTLVGLRAVTPAFDHTCTYMLFGVLEGLVEVSSLTYTSYYMFMSLLLVL